MTTNQGTIVIWVLIVRGEYIQSCLDPKIIMRDRFEGKWNSNGFHEFRVYDDQGEAIATLSSETLFCEGAALATVLANLRSSFESAPTSRIARPKRNPVNPESIH